MISRTSSLLLCAALAVAATGCGNAQEEVETLELSLAESAPSASQTFGFVLTDFTFEQPGRPENACPEGWNLNERDLLVRQTTDRTAAAAVPAGFDYIRMMRDRGGADPCKEPARFDAEPHLFMQGLGTAPGFDLDGVASTLNAPGPDACPHRDLTAPDGSNGIDNALWGALGCIWGYERGSTIDEYAISNIKEGQRTILVRLSGVDDPHNDAHVSLALYSGTDPIPADASGSLMSGASLGVTDDVRYHNVMDARIVDGVVSAGPIDLRLDFNGQFLDSEYVFRDARLRLEIQADGSLRGLVGGYWDIEHFYDAYARQATRSGAFSVGFRCPGMYGALKRRADAYPDDETGACTAISTVFRLAGIPAFVIEPGSTQVAGTANTNGATP